MWRLGEYKKYLCNKFLLVELNVVLIFFVLFVIYSFSMLSQKVYTNTIDFENVYEGWQVLQMVDNFFDEDDFYEYRTNKTSMQKVKNFYDQLNNEKSFIFISVFDQPIPVAEDYYKGNDTFADGEYYNRFEMDGVPFLNIKAFQMNKNAFDFYKLELSGGEIFDWKQVDVR